MVEKPMCSCNERTLSTLQDRGFQETDPELICRIVQGDPKAQTEFVRRFGRLIYAVLLQSGIPRQEVDDLYQQVYVHLWEQECRRLRQWRAGMGKLSSFLGVVVAHLAYDSLRGKEHAPVSLDEDLHAETLTAASHLKTAERMRAVETMLLHRQQKAAISCTLPHLKPRDAELIVRKHYWGQTYKQMAQAMSLTEANVGVALARAEERLRKRLYRDFPGLFELDSETKPRGK